MMVRHCPNCGKEVSVHQIKREETIRVKGENITTMNDVLVCNECGEDIWDNVVDAETLDRAYRIYRGRHGLLMPEEIKRIRESYGLSQINFARILGLGDKTITRYENGSLQDEAGNNLILLSRNPSVFALLFQKNKHRIPESEQKRFEDKRCPRNSGGYSSNYGESTERRIYKKR